MNIKIPYLLFAFLLGLLVACGQQDRVTQNPSPKAMALSSCPAGQYDPGTGCIPADPGFFVDQAGATEQTPCAIGNYQPDPGATSCIQAQPGFFVAGVEATEQLPCAAGTFQPDFKATSCKDTDPGYFTNQLGLANQLPCSPGYYQPNQHSTECLAATAGHYVPNPGSSTQTECAAGTYQPETAKSSCLQAQPGYFVPNPGAISQTPCSVGYYQPNPGSSACIAAVPGFYVPSPAAASATPCQPGYTSTVAAASCYPSSYNFQGFFQPVDNLPAINGVKAGSAVPVKFSLGGNQGLNIFYSGAPLSYKVPCDASSPQDDIEQTVTAGSSNLSYDSLSNSYIYVWKTDKAWAGQCRQLNVKLSDGSNHYANFKFK